MDNARGIIAFAYEAGHLQRLPRAEVWWAEFAARYGQPRQAGE